MTRRTADHRPERQLQGPVTHRGTRPVRNLLMMGLVVMRVHGLDPVPIARAAGLADRPQPALIASPEPGWPQWRGPRRDGICDETGLLPRWSEGGPPCLWSSTNLGRGYASPVMAGGRLHVSGETGDHLQLMALDLSGRVLWTATNGLAWKGPYPGARASCAVRDGRLFHLNAHGRLACLEAATGREQWAVELFERFGGKNIEWALSECVVVDGSRVMVTPGGTRALMAALDVRTGDIVWTTPPLRLGPSQPPTQERVAEPPGDTDSAGYSSPILFRLGTRRLLAHASQRHVFGVDADTGALLWTRPLPTRHHVIAATPVLAGDGLFVTAPDSGGGHLYQLNLQGDSVVPEQVWTTPLDTCHGGVVRLGDALYGSWYRARKGWACIDLATGAVRYESQAMAMGSVLVADGHLYCLTQEGEMALVRPTASGFDFDGRFRFVPAGSRDVWAHPVIVDRKLYLRHHERLACYDLGRH